jgi:hypothetical protein
MEETRHGCAFRVLSYEQTVDRATQVLKASAC